MSFRIEDILKDDKATANDNDNGPPKNLFHRRITDREKLTEAAITSSTSTHTTLSKFAECNCSFCCSNQTRRCRNNDLFDETLPPYYSPPPIMPSSSPSADKICGLPYLYQEMSKIYTQNSYNHVLPLNFSIYDHYSKRRNQVRFSTSQTKALEHKFMWQKYLSPEDRKHLAFSLKLSDRQVKTWFQNRRAKWRRNVGVTTSSDETKLNVSNTILMGIERNK